MPPRKAAAAGPRRQADGRLYIAHPVDTDKDPELKRLTRNQARTDEDWTDEVEDNFDEFADDDAAFGKSVAEIARGFRIREAALERNAARAGKEDVFTEVNWKEVKPKTSIPLDEDGVFLEERIHWISGQAGDGKTILGYWKLVQYAKRRRHSAIYECEMGEDLALGLLRNLGATEDNLKYIHYFKAKEEGTVINLVRNGRAFCQMLIRRGIMALLYDALNPLLVSSALNENIAADVRAWVTASCMPLSLVGGLIIVIDHEGQIIKGRARGSSDKAAAGHVDITLRKTETFARGIPGAIELTCNKDRTGSIVDGSKLIIRVDARADGSVSLKPNMWDWEISRAVPKVTRAGGTTQQKLIDYGRDLPEGFTAVAAATKLGLTRKAVDVSLGRGAKPDRNGETVFKQVKRGLWVVVAQ